ncbi:MAG: bactofilin family protein [Saccharofermentanales bacterium]
MSIKKHLSNFKLSNESDKIDTIIGDSVVIDGPIVSKKPVKIDGTVHGSVTTKSNVFLGPNAVINGDIRGKDVTVCGKVNGNVNSGGRLIITSKAVITGNMSMVHLVIDEGAMFNGNCTMGAVSDTVAEN